MIDEQFLVACFLGFPPLILIFFPFNLLIIFSHVFWSYLEEPDMITGQEMYRSRVSIQTITQ